MQAKAKSMKYGKIVCQFLGLTTRNWDLAKWFFSTYPMFCVWLKSNAAST